MGPVPRSWCSGSQSLWQRCGGGEKGEKMFQFMTFPQRVHRPPSPVQLQHCQDRPPRPAVRVGTTGVSTANVGLCSSQSNPACLSHWQNTSAPGGRSCYHRFSLKRNRNSEERSDSFKTNRAVVEPGHRCSHRTPRALSTLVPPASSIFNSLRDDLLDPAVT